MTGRQQHAGGGRLGIRPGPGLGWPGLGWLLRREIRRDAPVLVALGVLAALAALACAWGPAALASRQDDAVRQRLATAEQHGAQVSFSTTLNESQDMAGTWSGVARQLLHDAGPQLRASTRTVRETARFPPLDIGFDALHPALAKVQEADMTAVYADDADEHVRYVQGAAPFSAPNQPEPYDLAVSTAAAKGLGLKLNQRITVGANPGPPVEYRISGIFEVKDPGNAFWSQYGGLDQPTLYPPNPRLLGWGESIFGLVGVNTVKSVDDLGITPALTWSFAVNPAKLDVPAAAALLTPLARWGANVQADLCQPDGGYYTGTDFTDSSCGLGQDGFGTFTPADGVSPVLTAFRQERDQADAVQSIALACLVATVLATGYTATRLLLLRRAVPDRLQLQRGSSTARLVLARTLASTPVLAAAAAGGWFAGAALAPHASAGPRPGLAALCGLLLWLVLPVVTWRRLHEPRRLRRTVRRRARGRVTDPRRLTAELAVLALAVGAAELIRRRGTVSGTDPLLMLAPLLFSAVAALALLRVYPWLLRLLVGRLRGGRGALPFLGTARAAQGAGATALALFLLVLTLGTAVSGGLVTGTVSSGAAQGARWRVGADASVTAPSSTPFVTVSVPGVATVVEQGLALPLTSTQNGAQLGSVTVVTVDSAALAKAEPDSALTRALNALPRAAATDGASVVPVLLSPDLTANTPPHGDLAVPDYAVRSHGGLRLRPDGTLTTRLLEDPALGPLLSALPDGTPVAVAGTAATGVFGQLSTGTSAVLLYGTDPRALHTAASQVLGSGGQTAFLADATAVGHSDGLERGVVLVYLWCAGASVLLALVAVALELVLTSRERTRAATYLRTLGLAPRPATALNLIQLLPLALAAAAGGAVVGLVQPRLLTPALDLRQFTGGPAAPALHAAWGQTAVLAGALLLLILLTAAAETAVSHLRNPTTVLRLGEN